MLDMFFESEVSQRRLRAGPVGAYLDDLARWFKDKGFSLSVTRWHLRTANRFAKWGEENGLAVTELDDHRCEDFCRHLLSGLGYNRGWYDRLAAGARHFTAFLGSKGLLPSSKQSARTSEPVLLQEFRHWMRSHRGVFDATLDNYGRVILELLERLGVEPEKFEAGQLRQFVLDLSGRHGISYAKHVVTSVRMFVRFLIAVGKCPPGREHAIPTVAEWRLSRLPKYMQPEQVESVIAACETDTALGSRDRAIILLLARLGLRAGDVAGLRLCDLDWKNATLVVCGKNRRETRLPLPNDVGKAIKHYLKNHRPDIDTDRVFISTKAPISPISRLTVSWTARRAIKRAGIEAPSLGAYVFRHSAATAMLRQGASLYCIGSLLRHSSIETTAHYAKVDIDLLKEVAMPWPEVKPCS